tara:strand:- start:2894 stop:3136 length:243 start_codon:yes stop_codon:yes gene_type:complete
MINQCLFEKYFKQSLTENMTTASAGIGGTAATTDSSDFYAPGDARLPKSLFGGKILTRAGVAGKKRRKKRKKRRSSTKKK